MPQKQTLLEACEFGIWLATALFLALKTVTVRKAEIYREHGSMRRMEKTTYTTALFVEWEFGHVFLEFGKLTHTDVKGKHVVQRQERIFKLIWFHSSSSGVPSSQGDL